MQPQVKVYGLCLSFSKGSGVLFELMMATIWSPLDAPDASNVLQHAPAPQIKQRTSSTDAALLGTGLVASMAGIVLAAGARGECFTYNVWAASIGLKRLSSPVTQLGKCAAHDAAGGGSTCRAAHRVVSHDHFVLFICRQM